MGLFSRRKTADAAPPDAPPPPAPSAPAAASPAPAFTADDFRPRRVAMPVARDWASLAPLTPTVLASTAPVASPAATFIGDLAGTQQLVLPPQLRSVTEDGPAGSVEGLTGSTRDLPRLEHPGATAPVGEGEAEIQAVRRSVTARSLQDRPVLDSYTGDLVPVAPQERAAYELYDDAPAESRFVDTTKGGFEYSEDPDGSMREELPPPIFTPLLAQRTGQDLATLRPDLAGKTPEEIEAMLTGEAPKPKAPPREPTAPRRRGVSEVRKPGLGAPEFSPEAAALDVVARPVPTPEVAPPPPAPPVEAVEDGEYTLDQLADLFPMSSGVAEPTPAPPAYTPPPEPPAPPPAPTGPAVPTLVFRSRPGAPARRFPDGAKVREDAPADVRDLVARTTGHDPGPVSVNRGPEASARATAVGARAFTRSGEVFIPAEAGPLDSPDTRAVLAHELTHVVQQRVFGDRLPKRDTAEGHRLEAEAHAVERYAAGVGPAPERPRDFASGLDPALSQAANELVASGLASWAPDGSLVFGESTSGGRDDEWYRLWEGGTEIFPTDIDVSRDRLAELRRLAANASGDDAEEANSRLSQNERAFREAFGANESMYPTTTGNAAAKEAETEKDIDRQLAELKQQEEDARFEHRLETEGVDSMYGELLSGWNPFTSMFGDSRRGEEERAYQAGVDARKAKREGLEKKRQEIAEAQEKRRIDAFQRQRDAEEARERRRQEEAEHEARTSERERESSTTGTTGTTGTTTTTTPTGRARSGANAPLVHAPSGNRPGTTPPGTTEPEEEAESKRLERELKEQEAMWSEEDALEKMRLEEESLDRADSDAAFEHRLETQGPDSMYGELLSGWNPFGSIFGDSRKDDEKRKFDAEQDARNKKRNELTKKRERMAEKKTKQAAIKAAQQQEAAEKKKKAEEKKKADAERRQTGGTTPTPTTGGTPTTTRTEGDAVESTRRAAFDEGSSLSDSEGVGRASLHQLTEHDLEDLTNRLYDRVTTRLRSELLQSRERTGTHTDLR